MNRKRDKSGREFATAFLCLEKFLKGILSERKKREIVSMRLPEQKLVQKKMEEKQMKRKITAFILASCFAAFPVMGSIAADDYAPVTITVDLERSGLGDKVEETFTEPPTRAVSISNQLTDVLLDLGLENNIIAFTHNHDVYFHDFPGRDTIPNNWIGDRKTISKEQMLSVSPDFLIGWDSTFGEDYFNRDFCESNGINMYTPYMCTDFATFEDVYKDYETLGQIFGVEERAQERIDEMKKTIEEVHAAIGDEAYENPITIFNYDSGTDEFFTACQGLPGDIFKLAGGISIFDDVDKAWANVSIEQVVERNPQVIICNVYADEGDETIDFVMNNEALANVDAVVNGRVYAVNLDDLEGSCGSADMVREIASYLSPEKFQ